MTKPSANLPRLGILVHRGRDALFQGFISALEGHGRVDGRDILIVPRFAEGVLARTDALAEDLVRQNVDLVAAIGAVGAGAVRRATDRIPIVFAIILDPVDLGFAASLTHPGGNMTGVTNHDPGLAFEQLALLRRVVPGLDRVAVLSDPDIPRPGGSNPLERSCETAAATLGLALDWFRASGPGKDRTTLFREATRRGCKAVQVLEVPANITDFAQIAELATAFRLPAVFPGGWQHDGLISYGTSLLQTIPEMPPMIDLILRGTPPGEIPISQVRRHRLRVNLAAARRMGLGMPPDLLAQADEVVR